MKANFYKTAVILMVLFFCGCAARDQIVKTKDIRGKVVKKENLLLEPIDMIGLLETQALIEQKASFFEVVIPDMLFLGEMYPTRLKWFGRVVTKDKREYLAQLLLVYRINTDGEIIGVLEVDAPYEELIGAKAVVYSTRMVFAYSLKSDQKEIPIERKKITDDQQYRIDLAWNNGVELDTCPRADFMWQELQTWNRFPLRGRYILTTAGSDEYNYTLKMNPRYTRSQKLVDTTITITMSPIGTAMANFISLAEHYNIAPDSWCFEAKENRRNIAVIFAIHYSIKNAAIAKLKETNDALLLQCGNGEISHEKAIYSDRYTLRAR